MQHERQPLGGRQPLQDDEQRGPDRICQQRLLFRIDRFGGRDARRRDSLVERLFGPGAAGSQHVEADVCDDRGQPAAHVAHVADVGAIHSQPRLLDGVLCLGHRPEHPVGDRAKMRPMLLELIHLPSPPQ